MKVVTIPYSFDNYAYLIICEESQEAAVIDPGESYPVVLEVEKLGVKLQHVFCTHHHADHISGLPELLEEFSDLRVYCHVTDKNRISGVNSLVNHGDEISVGKYVGKVLYTPGHTKGSICFHFDEAVFVGDTLFGSGCGRLFEGSPEEMFESLNTVLGTIPADTKIYFGHEYTVSNLKFAHFIEPDNLDIQQREKDASSRLEQNRGTSPSTLTLELATNPFLRCASDSVVQSTREKHGVVSTDPVSVFTALRKLKDNF